MTTIEGAGTPDPPLLLLLLFLRPCQSCGLGFGLRQGDHMLKLLRALEEFYLIGEILQLHNVVEALIACLGLLWIVVSPPRSPTHPESAAAVGLELTAFCTAC